MAWLISKALYESLHCSQGLEAESSEDTCSDGEQSAQSNGNPTQLVYLQPDKMTAFSRLSRFGMTFRPLTGDRGEELLTLYREDFLARTYPAQGREQGLKESDQGCGNIWHESSMRYDLATHSWRTHLCLWDEALQWSSVTLPKWGMTVSGVLFQHPTAERPISGTGSGCWPTPTGQDNVQIRGVGKAANHPRRGTTLGGAVRAMWLTPSANEDAAGTPNGRMQKMLGNDPRIRGTSKEEWAAGSLNPDWVEWLMNWPITWSNLNAINPKEFQRWKEASAAAIQESSELRTMWWDRDPAQASSRQQPDEQPEQVVPRVASGVTAKVDRLKAIGNGQVPIVAATAWRVLSGN